jgi:hypothetical protein
MNNVMNSESNKKDWKFAWEECSWLRGGSPEYEICECLPDGRLWYAPVAGHRMVWAMWFRLAAYAVQRRLGVSIGFTPDDGVMLDTVHAPCGTKHCFVISKHGDIEDCSEPYAEQLPE